MLARNRIKRILDSVVSGTKVKEVRLAILEQCALIGSGTQYNVLYTVVYIKCVYLYLNKCVSVSGQCGNVRRDRLLPTGAVFYNASSVCIAGNSGMTVAISKH